MSRAAATLRRMNRRPEVVRAVRATRGLLPGDENFGDQLSTASDIPSATVARYLGEREPGGDLSASREAGLAALQVWQALSQRVGRGAGSVQAVILFTDLVGFSSWVLDAGDEAALELLRAVAGVVEPAITSQGGRVVKRLGDGHMAVFTDARAGVDAALEMHRELESVEVAGHRPALRAGLHLGQPRKLGGDYLGADVNIAARLGEAAGAGELLVSGAVASALGQADGGKGLEFKRKRWFRAKGVPRDLEAYVVSAS